jgi:phosphatidylcholine synthase
VASFGQVRAFAIHVFTATGAALAFLALILATGGHWAAMFFTLGVALVVDGVDGPLARAFHVTQELPRWSGETLDIVVDFVTYVFVPAYAIGASGLLPHAVTLVAGIAICITAVLVVLTFAPIKFLHPLRVARWRAFHVALLVAWALLALVAVAADLSPGPYVSVPLSAIALYFFLFGLLRRPA